MNKITSAGLMMLASTTGLAAPSSEDCLAAIMYAESRGEPITGVVAIGHAAINRAKAQKRQICKITGVSRKTPPANEAPIYKTLAKAIIKGHIPDISRNSNSWNAGKKPAYKGSIKRIIGGHVFYSMAEYE